MIARARHVLVIAALAAAAVVSRTVPAASAQGMAGDGRWTSANDTGDHPFVRSAEIDLAKAALRAHRQPRQAKIPFHKRTDAAVATNETGRLWSLAPGGAAARWRQPSPVLPPQPSARCPRGPPAT